MRKPRKRSFQELVLENKMQLLKDREAIEKIEERLERKHLKKLVNVEITINSTCSFEQTMVEGDDMMSNPKKTANTLYRVILELNLEASAGTKESKCRINQDNMLK